MVCTRQRDFELVVRRGTPAKRVLEAVNTALLSLFKSPVFTMSEANSIFVRGACARDMLTTWISARDTSTRGAISAIHMPLIFTNARSMHARHILPRK